MKSILSPFQKIILDELCKEKFITKNFRLAGGTALSEFYLKHRYSEDLDFFTDEKQAIDEVKIKLTPIFNRISIKTVEYREISSSKIFFLKKGQKETVKTDFNYFPFKRFVQGKTKLPRASVKLSGYSSNNTNSIEYLYDVISPFDNVSKFINAEHVFILDGSVMTGRTLEQFVNLLPKNIDEIYSGFVSFNASNRYHHVTRINHGGVNPLILEGSIIGVKGAFSHTITKEEYTDEYGIFDINKHYTIQMLIQQQS